MKNVYLVKCSLGNLISCPTIGKTLEWTLRYDEYKEHLLDHAPLTLHLIGHVEQTKQVVATQFHFRLRTPDLVLAVSL